VGTWAPRAFYVASPNALPDSNATLDGKNLMTPAGLRCDSGVLLVALPGRPRRRQGRAHRPQDRRGGRRPQVARRRRARLRLVALVGAQEVRPRSCRPARWLVGWVSELALARCVYFGAAGTTSRMAARSCRTWTGPRPSPRGSRPGPDGSTPTSSEPPPKSSSRDTLPVTSSKNLQALIGCKPAMIYN
jgi:hypothetical protein